jgi:hypothetical protein
LELESERSQTRRLTAAARGPHRMLTLRPQFAAPKRVLTLIPI